MLDLKGPISISARFKKFTYCNTLRRYEFYGMNEERFQKVYSRQKLNEPIKYDELEILYQTTCIKIDLPNMDFKRQIRC